MTQAGILWKIDNAWFQPHGRSLTALEQASLCPACRKKLTSHGTPSTEKIQEAVKNCCSKKDGFITPEQPLMESVFRFFLSTGNKPASIEDVSEKLNTLRGIDAYRTSVSVLTRLLMHDQYYGIRPVIEEVTEK